MQTYHAEMGRTMDLLFLDEDLSVGRLNPLTPSFRKRMLEERGIPTEDSFCGEYCTFLRRIEGLSPEDSCYVWCSKDPYELTGVAMASTYLASKWEHVLFCDSGPLQDVEPARARAVCDALLSRAAVTSLRPWAALWKRLQEENTSLRIAVDGLPRSVPETFFDPWIQRLLAQEAPQERDNFSIAIQVEEEYRTRFHGRMNIHFLLHRVDVVRRREM